VVAKKARRAEREGAEAEGGGADEQAHSWRADQPARMGRGRMSMEIETRLSDQIGRYLDLAAAEAKLTAANMANVDTPGYRTVGMDFEAEMRQAMDDVDRGQGPRKVRVADVDGMITQRAFEANAKSVTTFDTVTQDTINMVH
jgi:flagellar basal-body rod protein FlgB